MLTDQCPESCVNTPCVDYEPGTGHKLTGPCTCTGYTSWSSAVHYCANYELKYDRLNLTPVILIICLGVLGALLIAFGYYIRRSPKPHETNYDELSQVEMDGTVTLG